MKCCSPFPVASPASSPRQIPLGAGRCCNAREEEIFAVLEKGEKCTNTGCFASNSSPVGFATEGRIVQTLSKIPVRKCSRFSPFNI